MAVASSTYEDWIPKWKLHLAGSDDTVRVPPSATTITTPLITETWLSLLADHPDKALTKFFITGISQGFRIGYTTKQSSLKSAGQNLTCALHHPEVVDQYLSEELAYHHVAGPFNATWAPYVHVSRFGFIPRTTSPTSGDLSSTCPTPLVTV